MPNDDSNDKDRDLLSRLNALKKSHINLEAEPYKAPTIPDSLPIDPAPAHALHTDLLSRFKSLQGNPAPNTTTTTKHDPITNQTKPEDDKTLEELLADLGPAEEWSIEKSEEENVADLLKSANLALSKGPDLEHIPDDEDEEKRDAGVERDSKKPGIYRLPSIDVEVFKPEPDSDEEGSGPRKTKTELNTQIDREADEVLKRLMDEVKYESQQTGLRSGEREGEEEPPPYSETDTSPTTHKAPTEKPTAGTNPSTSLSTFNLPNTPSKPLPAVPPPPSSSSISNNDDADSALSARFANLSLPSPPTSNPQTSSKAKAKPKPPEKLTDEQIDSWCIICLSDATLECIGCDGDLYCAKCWVEGHRGPDAGFEERMHKAKEFGRKKKGKRMVGIGM